MNKTKWFMVITAAIILLVDLYFLPSDCVSATSYEITRMSWYSPWMPFAWGFLMSHFFPTRMRKDAIG